MFKQVDEELNKASAPAVHTDSPARLLEKACQVLVGAHLEVARLIKPGVSTKELDAVAEDYILSHGGEPAFKGYKVSGHIFPATLCISIDAEVVHGIPSESRVLEEGQIVSIDCGVKKDGYYGDCARTYPVGTVSEEKNRLIRVTSEALDLAVSQAVARNKVYDISRAVQTHVEQNGFSVVRELTGHGIGKKLHQEPAIPNFVPPLLHRQSYPNVKLLKGMALAIEPMVNAGHQKVLSLSDHWTIVTADGMPSAHFEHTVIVDENKPIILTVMG